MTIKVGDKVPSGMFTIMGAEGPTGISTADIFDGKKVVFRALSPEDFKRKCGQKDLEGTLYRQALEELSLPEARAEIHAQFPKKSIHRRNTGYAVDELLKASQFEGTDNFNFCKLFPLINNFKTGIRLKYFRNKNSVFRLVIFQNSS